MSIASRQVTSPDNNPFDTKSLVESLCALDSAVYNNTLDTQSPERSSPSVEEKSAGIGSPSSAVAGADDPEEQMDAAEKRLWDEVKEIITTFG